MPDGISEEVNSPEVDEYLLSIDNEINVTVTKVKEGTHLELEKRAVALRRAKENKMASADRHRKMQIKNINLLYEYELEDANALYNKAYCEMQEQMVQELQMERQRLKALYRQKVLQQTALQSNANARDPSANSSSRATAVASVPGENNKQSNGTRSTRSTVPALDLTNTNNEEYISADSKLEMLFNSSKAAVGHASSALLAGLPMGGRNGATRRKPNNVATNGIPPLDQVLSETNMRSDLLEIVRDLQTRAASFERTRPKALDRSVSLGEDLGEVRVGGEAFAVGDAVCVFSALSQETLSGIITALSTAEVVVRVGGGARFSFLVSQLRSGRVTLSRDAEALQAINTMRAAVQSVQQQKVST